MRKLVIGLAALALCFAPLMAAVNLNVLSDRCNPTTHLGVCSILSENGNWIYFIYYEDLPADLGTTGGNPVYNNCFDANHDQILDVKWCWR